MKKPAIIVPEGVKEVLLHACCAPCSSAIVEWMLANGVVYEICADECFYAWQGGGAWLCGTRSEECGVRSERLHVSSQKMQDALLCLQFPYNSDA